MRIKLKLRVLNSKFFPYNYHYSLASIIYSLIGASSEEFAVKLHDEGYRIKSKIYKLFTFALRFANVTPNNDKLELSSPKADFFISSPLTDDFMSNLISGILKLHNSELKINNSDICLKIDKLEVMENLHFETEANFRLLSPLVLSTRKNIDGNLGTYYLRYDDNKQEINRILSSNLRNKYNLIYKKISEGNVELAWDENYISKRLAENKHLSTKVIIGHKKLIHSKTKEGISIIGINAPFKLIGDPELIKTGYECGFGEKNSMGFGMAEVV